MSHLVETQNIDFLGSESHIQNSEETRGLQQRPFSNTGLFFQDFIEGYIYIYIY